MPIGFDAHQEERPCMIDEHEPRVASSARPLVRASLTVPRCRGNGNPG